MKNKSNVHINVQLACKRGYQVNYSYIRYENTYLREVFRYFIKMDVVFP